MTSDYSKAPRLYIPDDLTSNEPLFLSRDHAHYLLNVMRKGDGDIIRIFDGVHGEFIAKLSVHNKKSIELKWIEQIKEQKSTNKNIHLYCPPIKKDRFAFMIEKAVELGVTEIHPIATERTQNAKINIEKCEKQIIEAVEQCERMNIPEIHKPQSIMQCDFITPSYVGIERRESTPLFTPGKTENIGVIIGPEGGWTVKEIDYLSSLSSVTPVSLGDTILRAETAAIFMLSRIG